ncbi:iron-containing alcohol dehydrogenase [Roseospira marina]|uniref:Alcohol dehydrogenase 2 n=1 Tax=Roseospira marina TaxID=140057 RepID=A0A5M6IGN9_9PROT|nr:1-propanol dehydrogenase PduQ [Roseospira marina]KAA5607057.1 iron-containing alcohol dehydrogenase [Roseospira marina]MBB4312753.1 alcohol dehydrogenase class IV [Roseospira marina]MBB5086474.1 alcohol dehydrogenase class IV [Roseospira marina]
MSGLKRFNLKTEIVFGANVTERLRDFEGRRVGLITDAMMAKVGIVERFRASLPACTVAVYDSVLPDSPRSQVAEASARMADFGPDVLVALGGGSVIDAAKAIVATVRALVPDHPIPLVAVPTTSGTGSEVTSWAVISEPEKGIKYPLISDEIIPDIALLDPELVRSVPPAVTADTGMDVLTHAIEAFVSVGATDYTDAFAEKAVSLAVTHLPTAYATGDDMTARTAMHHASCMAGIAFANAGLGLNHAIAHSIGGRLHLPHGRINAMLLPAVIACNAGVRPGDAAPFPTAARYAALAQRVGLDAPNDRAGARALARHLAQMNARMNVPATLRAAGVDMAAYAAAEADLVRLALADKSLATNPRTVSADDVLTVLRAVAG